MGFTPPRSGFDFCKAAEMDVAGRMPIQAVGVRVSGSYTHGPSPIFKIVSPPRGGLSLGQIGGGQGRRIDGLGVPLSALARAGRLRRVACVRAP